MSRSAWTEQLTGEKPVRNKYGNVKGKNYHSKKEASRAAELSLMEKAGQISDLTEQPKFELIPAQAGERAATYTGDFQYWENGKMIVEDVKSEVTRKTQMYIIRRKLMLWVHGIRIRET